MISLIAVLKAKPGQTDALRQALQALLDLVAHPDYQPMVVFPAAKRG